MKSEPGSGRASQLQPSVVLSKKLEMRVRVCVGLMKEEEEREEDEADLVGVIFS
jgi:hypothetical protein